MDFKPFYSGSAGNLYRVTSGDKTLLIDPGVTIKRIKHALGFKVSTISAALVSHSHLDHCKAVGELMHAGIDCFMTAPTAKALGLQHHRLNIIEPRKRFEAGGFWCVAFETKHDCPGAVGFWVTDGQEKLFYLTDSYYVRDRFRANIIALEVNYSPETIAPGLDSAVKHRLYKSHMSLSNAIKLLQATDLSLVREIWMIHTSKGNGDPAYFKQEIEKATGRPVFSVGDL
jgi:phosphoribosyl 1,2-cyclic phosphodiesterase